MNWSALTFDWNQARAFLATAEEGSLSAAARALGLTQPTIGRQIAALEEELGVILFERQGRSITLTPTGTKLLTHVQEMADAAAAFSLAANGQSTIVDGDVTISVSDVIAAHILPEILPDLTDRAPGLSIEIVATYQLSDLRKREADIALRHLRPTEPDLYARLICDMTARPYVSRRFMEQLPQPPKLEDLKSLPFIGFGNKEQMAQRMTDFGFPIAPSSVRYNCVSGVVAWQMVRDGLGVGVMADDVARRCPEVVPLFSDSPPISFPLWIVTHRELKTSRKIRLVFDFLAERLRSTLGQELTRPETSS